MLLRPTGEIHIYKHLQSNLLKRPHAINGHLVFMDTFNCRNMCFSLTDLLYMDTCCKRTMDIKYHPKNQSSLLIRTLNFSHWLAIAELRSFHGQWIERFHYPSTLCKWTWYVGLGISDEEGKFQSPFKTWIDIIAESWCLIPIRRLLARK